MSDRKLIKSVRVRSKISTDGSFWDKPKDNDYFYNDINLELKEDGRKRHLLIFQTTGQGYGIRTIGASYLNSGRTPDEIITDYVDYLNKIIDKSSQTGENTNPLGASYNWTREFAIHYKGLTGLSPFWEIVQDPYDDNIGLIPGFPAGYFKPWNDWVDSRKKEEAATQSATQSATPSATQSTIPKLDPKTINSKITLKKKSGPGELIGDVEGEMVAGFLEFKGLQFSEPGEYVVIAIPNSSDLEQGEITIKVESQESVIEQPVSKGNEESVPSGPRPCIAQIDAPTYVLPPMSIPAPPKPDSVADTAQNLGLTPFFFYNGYQIDSRNISLLNLSYDGLFPKVQIEFKDTFDLMKKYPPLDDTKFELFFNASSANIKSIHLKFKYESHNFLDKKGIYSLSGTIDIPLLYTVSSKSYTGTSFESLRNISKELSLGFNSNIDNTNDSMKWINTNKKVKDFIQDIVEHSYISDSSFMIGYIDYYFSFNYVDIEKEWNRDNSKDVGVDTSGLSKETRKDEDLRIVRMGLNNDFSSSSSCFYFKEHTIRNNSTYQSIRKGYSTKVKYYDESTKEFLVFDVDSLTSEGDKTIIMKGAPGDAEYFNANYTTKYGGKLDDDNAHKHYAFAQTQNRVNLDNLVKISVNMTLPNPNFNLYKFQKIKINFIVKDKTPTNDELTSSRYDGDWLITDISFNWNGKRLSQVVKAVKKELGKTPDEIKNDAPQAKSENKDLKTKNPDPEQPKPNSKYKVGDVYKVSNTNGEIYEITITSILDNGVDVEGKIVKISAVTEYPSQVVEPVVKAPDPKPAELPNKSDTIILMCGLDNRPGDLNVDQQVKLLKETVKDKNIIGFRYTDIAGVKNSIKDNPNAYVVLFSAGCGHSSKLAPLIQDKGKLFIVEPYGSSVNTKNSVASAVSVGTPSKNVVTGPAEARGLNIVTDATLTPKGLSHWNALKWVGNLIV